MNGKKSSEATVDIFFCGLLIHAKLEILAVGGEICLCKRT